MQNYDVFEELDNLYENDLSEANNNYSSNKAKDKLIDKYFEETGLDSGDVDRKAFKHSCLLHHINGEHNDDTELANDVLIIANDAEDAKLAHKLIHLLSYCYIKEDLLNKLNELDVEFYYHPDYSNEPQEIDIKTLATGLAQHDKRLRDIALIDQDEEDLDALGKNNFRIDN